jgi:hypothetical protein
MVPKSLVDNPKQKFDTHVHFHGDQSRVDSPSKELKNGQPFPSLNAMDKPVQNADGSTDLYFGPTAPPGKESNWLQTVPGKGPAIPLPW